MTVTIDLNVVLDMLLQRGQYGACLELLTLCKEARIRGLLPSHGIPTIYYILRKSIGHERSLEAVRKLLKSVEVFPVSKEIVLHAFDLNFSDFEDAIIAASAEASGSTFIITRDARHFRSSRIRAISPEEFLELLPTE
ncbi:MAG TPA: PIN domain-containing protein [Candidatus Kapabacteria bacterium]|nr:PIN domain-containing protein [Candidatus Kapabacteria bacterium]